MKVILQNDVKNVGKVGEIVSVSKGYARNFLFPKRLAVLAAEDKIKAWEHLQKVAEQKKKKIVAARKELLAKVADQTLTFKVTAGEKDKIFGAVTPHDISTELEKKGFEVDRRDIKTEAIKSLGQHMVVINLGEGLEAEVTVVVEKA